MPPGRVRRMLRRIVAEASAELRNENLLTEAERMAVSETSQQIARRLTEAYQRAVYTPDLNDDVAQQEQAAAQQDAQRRAQRAVNPDTLREAPATRRPTNTATYVVDVGARQWSALTSMAIFPVLSGSADSARQLLPTITRSVRLPQELSPSVPLQEPPRQPTVSSSPAASNPPPLPIAWDDPTVKRVRRVVIEDE